MARRKRREASTFSLSFLDCICCGFGAVILLFVLTAGKKGEAREQEVSELPVDMTEVQRQIDETEADAAQLASDIETLRELLAALVDDVDTQEDQVNEAKNTLALLLQSLAELEQKKATLIAEKEELPKTDEPVPVPVPNPVQRQFLTDFKTAGERVLILVEASGGMLRNTPDEAIAMLAKPDHVKRGTEKWQRTIRITNWVLGTLRPPTRFQIYVFNDKTESVIASSTGRWLDLADKAEVGNAIAALNRVVPSGGANLEQAFIDARSLRDLPDNIILIADGLPTASLGQVDQPIVTEEMRQVFFKRAWRQAPAATPINVILLPMSGDPSAASLFWQLADAKNGSFITPARSWPSI